MVIYHPETQFIYRDTDNLQNEIAELYDYEEIADFQNTSQAFEYTMKNFNLEPKWKCLDIDVRKSMVINFLSLLESKSWEKRLDATLSILYLVQGCWVEAKTVHDVEETSRSNVIIMHELNVFETFVGLLKNETSNCVRQLPGSVEQIRAVLSVLYIMTETIRWETTTNGNILKAFTDKMRTPICNELFIITLFDMMKRFFEDSISQLPIKKILLLIWKTILITLGGVAELKKLKQKYREENNLPPDLDDNSDIILDMPFSLMEKEHNLNESYSFDNDESYDSILYNSFQQYWHPKAHQEEINAFLNDVQIKYIGDSLENPTEHKTDFPYYINEAIDILKRNEYIRLADIQIQSEINIINSPLLNNETFNLKPAEDLYKAMHSNLQSYLMAIIKILSFASKNLQTTDQDCKGNIDVNNNNNNPEYDSVTMNIINTTRRSEIIVKASSAILFLLVKHYKINHVYQFENICEKLIDSNISISTIIDYISQPLHTFLDTKNSKISSMEFPLCMLPHVKPCNNDSFDGNSYEYSWRNIFSCTNFLRILNKIVKKKEVRIMSLFLLDSAKPLNNLLAVNNATIQFYALKLIKMQVKYLGKEWLRRNYNTLNAIYFKLRNGFHENWTCSIEFHVRKKPLEICQEDEKLVQNIEEFHKRRYSEYF